MSLASLKDFVPGIFAVPENTVMRGQGVGSLRDFVGGSFVVPENTVMRGVGSLVPSAPMWPIPPNSVMAAWNGAGMSGLGCGGGCGCGGSCGHDSGMGQLSLSTFTAPFTNAWTDVQAAISAGSITPITMEDWLVIAGTAAAAYMLLGKKGRR